MSKSSSPAVDFSTTEKHVIADLKSNPNDMQSVFKELHQLQGSESLTQFRQDLIKMNKDLHDKGLLPNLEIVDDPTALDGFKTQPAKPGDTGSSSGSSSQPAAPSEQPWVNPNGDSNAGGGSSGGGGGGSSGGGGGGGGGGGDSGGGGGGSSGGGGGGRSGGDGGGSGGGGVGGASSVNSGALDSATVTGKDIVQNAEADQHQALWNDKPGMVGITQNGNLGCAESVCHVLKQSGVTGVDSPSVQTMSAQLLANGGPEVPLNAAKPGDVVVFGNNDHTGIMGANGSFYGNSSGAGQWTKYNSVSDIGQTVTHIIRPPETQVAHNGTSSSTRHA